MIKCNNWLESPFKTISERINNFLRGFQREKNFIINKYIKFLCEVLWSSFFAVAAYDWKFSSNYHFFLFYFFYLTFYLLKCNNERERDLSLKLNAIIMCVCCTTNIYIASWSREWVAAKCMINTKHPLSKSPQPREWEQWRKLHKIMPMLSPRIDLLITIAICRFPQCIIKD